MLSLEGWLAFAREMELSPRILSRSTLVNVSIFSVLFVPSVSSDCRFSFSCSFGVLQLFEASKGGILSPGTPVQLNFSEFLECCGRTASVAFANAILHAAEDVTRARVCVLQLCLP